ncbi:hypothetical protein GOBAR_AA15508 [Gossypium barbadense]|uniref:SWIM-type domain-containing protein n=1 Tax=Gossypium barbadense TaxID=3634 RepID=A0A2P5XPB2_GOSBA|nr:hypothetical protein GOBAR_AA15508 [Gossypium barbadense]
MELVDDEDVETMVALYCGTWSNQNAPIQLFAELAGVEETEDPTPLGEEDRAQEPCMVVPVSYVSSQLTIHGIDIDLNAAPETAIVGDDVYHSSDPSDHEVVKIRRIVIHNNPGAHMSRIDPDAAHVAEFPEYPEIQFSHRMAVYSDPEELFVGQRFENKEECVFSIKRYSMNISVDYKVTVSKPTLYIGECWKSAEGCNRRIRAAFIQKSQMWEIRKFVGSHTCTSSRMIEDHRKLDSKTICTCIMPMVEDMPTIKVLVLIAEIQARFQYQVSYGKAWIAKQMEIEQLYGDFDASYNELQGWIAAMREDAMVANRRMARSMNVEVYSRRNETFHVIETINRRPGIPPRSYRVDLRNRRCDCRRFQTLHYLCVHVVAACAKVSLNVDQFIDEVYTLECTLHLWENEFPVLPDLSTWEVPPTTFELVPDKGLRRNPKCRPQSSRIRNEMDIREKSDGQLCRVCRLPGHNWNKCPLRNYHIGQSSRSDRN